MDALRDSDQAVLSYPDEDGRGRARICKGEVFFHLGDITKAIAETSAGLRQISLPGSALYHRCAVYNIGAFIIHSENPPIDAVFFAARQMEEAKKLFRGLRGEELSAERARFDWTFAILHWRLGQVGRRTRRLLTSARDRFVALAMAHEADLAQEAAAVTADLAWFTGFDRREIRCLLGVLDPLKEIFKEEVLRALRALQDATRAKSEATEAIRAAIMNLREKATGPGVVPSMLMLLASESPIDDPSPIGF